MNRIKGSDEEVAAELKKILASSRANNPSMDITGALLYTEGKFAQVLEGPMEAVNLLFETIQRDERHSDAIVIYSASTAERDFSLWSMAFAGNVAPGRMPATTAAFAAARASSSGAGTQMLSLLRELVVRDDDPNETSV
jgi:hypothetical protein